ncbi:VWA domain-containing protein [Amorphoplanes digitatis]|uniref:VWFA domain-containing protein n=1 Tax=Actinoplanes digitatis TaxID=1868 RepID=A0A7W7I018_9ACTN|nr:VWA domain-containing protein [Actinoplanes digitatis]MBB4763937.1 hypothetical protein [Actinoplanes digitatis]GID93756.1 hypothetical protein Adi01nite_31680 [Actinoplanes digitatis]
MRVPAALLTMLVVLCAGPLPAAAAIPLPVIAVLPGAERTCLVVDLSAVPGAARTATVTVDGAPLRAELTPVISDGLAVVLVVDASDAGAPALPAWLSAAARFVLEVPSGTRASAIADTSPPALLTPPGRGPAGVVAALSSVRAGGRRSTSSALTLALRQFPGAATGPRVVVVYTSSADAGGESAAALAARLVRAETMLVVVGAAGDGAYWADAARATGGFFAPAGTPVVVPALDQVETTLRGRHLVRFATPADRPARVSVRIDTGGLSLTGGAVVPADPVLPPGPPPGTATGARWWPIAGFVALLAVALIMSDRSRRRRGGPPSAAVEDGQVAGEPVRAVGMSPAARGRAPVPPPAAAHQEPPETTP